MTLEFDVSSLPADFTTPTGGDLLLSNVYFGLELDPFADSAEAVHAFEAAQFTELVLHNVADILRTRALGRLAQRYCSKSDFSVKSLTAVHDAESHN